MYDVLPVPCISDSISPPLVIGIEPGLREVIAQLIPFVPLAIIPKFPVITSANTPETAVDQLNPLRPSKPALWYLSESSALSVLAIAP